MAHFATDLDARYMSQYADAMRTLDMQRKYEDTYVDMQREYENTYVLGADARCS